MSSSPSTRCVASSTSTSRSSARAPATSSRRIPYQQLDLAIRSVFHSWNTDRARLYRRQERIPHTLGTAVNVQVMAFGNAGPGSGTGVAFTRDPGSGQRGIYGDYLPDAQGEDVVAGIRNTLPLQELENLDPASYTQLMDIMHKLELHYRDLCDIEFTVERGKLWMLQTRVGKRTAGAAFRIAVQLVDEGVISMDEALMRVSGHQLSQLMFPRFAAGDDHALIAKGMNASPGAAVGRVVFDSSTAVKWAAARGEGDPRPSRDQPRRPRGHDRCGRHPDEPRRQDLARGRRRPRHGQDRRLRRRAARGRHQGPHDGVARRRHREGGRHHLDRRHHRRGVPRRGAGHAQRHRDVLRGRARGRARGRRRAHRRAHQGSRPPHAARGQGAAPARARQRRHSCGRDPRPAHGGRGGRPAAHRAHVPGGAEDLRRAADPRR